ncbi:uncharacterized protein LOC112325074 isoform X2 [Populus trichocarpa]|uniref:uncharacterized protein LOC112325074 isoform X2 n=1 Tax=Populus trichocarpa TaxID=3694 RepID=UPI002279AF1D|nr:uncharacterized protein LOC112325074 isoform X2 [Populus trichocarpa]
MPYIFIGYLAGQKVYKLYNLSTKKVITSRDVFFHETIFPYASNKTISHCDPFPAYSHSPIPFTILDTSSFNHNLTEQPSSSQPIAPDNVTPSFSMPPDLPTHPSSSNLHTPSFVASDLPTPDSHPLPPPNPEPLLRSSRPHNPRKKLQDYMCSHITHAYTDPSTSLLPDPIKARQWSLHHLDVNNVFLHGDLHKEIYMSSPPGLRRQGEENLVCRLHKSLYGLKQASRQWFSKFSEVIQAAVYVQSRADYLLFTRTQA